MVFIIQFTVLNQSRSLRRSELAMSYAEGVADKFGGDVAHAMRASAGIIPPLMSASGPQPPGPGLMQSRSSGGRFKNSMGMGLRSSNERKSGDASTSYSGRLPPMGRSSGGAMGKSTSGGRSSRGGGSARTVEDILAEHKERSQARRANN
jgi:hypothetical protein